jgi:hypothetical protein
MKLAKAKLKLLGILAVSVCLLPAVWAQAKPAQKPAEKAAPKAAPKSAPKMAQSPAQKPAHRAARRARTAHPAAVKPAPVAPAANPEASQPQAAPAGEAGGEAGGGEKLEGIVNKRDPFVPLISGKKEAGGVEHLPPGKAGLVIASVRVDGTVKSTGGMIAVVSNPEQHVYFIREGDQLYDGDVEKIGLDGVTFKENSKDAFGKPVEHMVTKRIYPSAGEQQ